ACPYITPFDILSTTYRDFENVYNQGNAKEIAQRFFTKDAKFISFDKNTYEGQEQIEKAYQGAIDAGSKNFQLTPSTIHVAGPYLIATGHYKSTIAAGNFQEIWKQENGEWLLFIVIIN
ncbi:unnamed protein product, partial [Didymodactylos carnosus]